IFSKSTPSGQALFIVGDEGIILKSNNQGLIWEKINSNTVSDLNAIDIGYSDTGYVVGSNGTILRSADGGNSWQIISGGTTNTLNDVRIINSDGMRVIAVGENGTFLKLTDGAWVSSQIDTADLNSITYMTIVGNSGTILRSTDSGINWNRMISPTTNHLNYISSANGFILGDSGTALQINGNNIFTIKTGTFNNLYGLDNYDNRYTLCGSNGTILYNYGNFQSIYINTTENLNSILKTNIDKCFLVGDNGKIFFTGNINLTPNAKILNSNSIAAWFFNNGLFNQHAGFGSGGFEWPRGENKTARFSSGSLIGAIVNGDTLVTVCDYDSEYLPGYTDNNGMPNGNESPDYRLYKLVYGINDSDRIDWPNILLGNSDQGAPVYYDSLTLSYKPIDYGNQTMFYSYTDSYLSSHTHYAGRTDPLKVDIKQINYSFNQPEELKNIIYQEFRIINRSTSVWNNAFINLYTDDDLGSASDDAEGVDTNLSLAYTYNSTNNDGIYGPNPPAVGFAVIRSPLIFTGNSNDSVFYYEGKKKRIKVGYKEIKLGSTAIYHDDSWQPRNYRESYNAIRGLKNDGTSYINPVTNQPTRFVYSGDPVTNTGWINFGGDDKRFYQGFGPMNINPGDTQVIVIAQVIARGSSNINSITKLREATVVAKQYYDNCFEDVVIGINNISQNVPDNFYLSQNYPNPFNPVTKINYTIGTSQLSISSFISLKVYDALGKEVAVLVNKKLNAGKYEVEFDGSDFASGIYFYSLYINENLMETKRMLLVK
ncbi:MAG: T9SS type A sorting domain-containing protein, partial [Ignavibacteria bacterium]